MEIPTLCSVDVAGCQSEDPPSFHHEPLNDLSKEFRLVEILSGDDEIIRCKVSRHSLAAPPEYYAASYEWGDDDSPEFIELNGCTFSIRHNLWMFLQELRWVNLPSTNRGFFIDAICIDQDHSRERNTQVQIMAEIYSKAKRVHAWLGDAADDSDSLIDLCVSDYMEDLQCRIDAIENQRPYQPQLSLPSVTHVDWLPSIVALFSRTYWHRLWIIQEILLAQSITLHCGSRVITWSAVDRLAWTFVDLLSKGYHEQGREFKVSGLFHNQRNRSLSERFMHIVNLRRQNHPALPFAMLLDIFGEAKCTDAHDKVYGFMGLASEFRSGDSINVDYSQPVEMLFFDTLKHCDPTQRLIFAKRLYDILHLEKQPHLLEEAAVKYDSKIRQNPAEICNHLQVEVIRLGGIRRGRRPCYGDAPASQDDPLYKIYDMKNYRREKKLRKDRSVSNPTLSLNEVEFYSLSSVQKGDAVYWLHGTKFAFIYRRNPRQTMRKKTRRSGHDGECGPGYQFLCGTTVSVVNATKTKKTKKSAIDEEEDQVEKINDLLESLELSNAIIASELSLLHAAPPALITIRAVDFIQLVRGFIRPVVLQWSLDGSLQNIALLCRYLTELIGMVWKLSEGYAKERGQAEASMERAVKRGYVEEG